MRKTQTLVGWVEGHGPAKAVLDAAILAMKSCARKGDTPATYSVTAQMPEGTITMRSLFFCGGTEHEFAARMTVGHRAAMQWYNANRPNGGTPRRCELSIVLEAVDPSQTPVFVPKRQV